MHEYNVGQIDRAIRIVAGLSLVLLSTGGVIGAWGWIGLIPLATGIVRVCPVYMPFGLSSCSSVKR